MVMTMMLGREAELKDGSKGIISQRILNMFTEAKRVNSNEQHTDDEQNVQLVRFHCILGNHFLACNIIFVYFLNLSHFRIQWRNNSRCDWMEKLFPKVFAVLNSCGIYIHDQDNFFLNIISFIVSGLFWHKMSSDCVALFHKILHSAEERRSWYTKLQQMNYSDYSNFQSLKDFFSIFNIQYFRRIS